MIGFASLEPAIERLPTANDPTSSGSGSAALCMYDDPTT
jgi:hypothetical protein